MLYFLAAALIIMTGCARQEVEYTKKWGFGFKDKGHYPKLKDYHLTLELSSGSRKFAAGAPGELIFILRNRGTAPVRIPEWHKFDPNNLNIQCQVWLPGTQKPESDMWLDISAPVKRPIWRYVQAYWMENAWYAQTTFRHLCDRKNGNFTALSLVEDGMFESALWFPVLLCGELLWNPYADTQVLLRETALNPAAVFA